MKDNVKNWIDSATYDLETAENLFESGRYIYCVFFCHLALEKVLKAAVEKTTNSHPPKTHDLEYLLELSGLNIDNEMEAFLGGISNVSTATRYPNDTERLVREYSKDRTKKILARTKEVFRWIEQLITS